VIATPVGSKRKSMTESDFASMPYTTGKHWMNKSEGLISEEG